MAGLVVPDWPPAPVRTERLVLRSTEPRDRESFLDLASDDRVRRYLGGPQDRAELEEKMPDVPADRPGSFAVEHDGRCVGRVSIGRRDAARPGRVGHDWGNLEISYLMLAAQWGHGFATEAVAALLDWAAQRWDEPVVLCTQTANARSMALAQRLGFSEVERFQEFGAEQWFGVRQPPALPRWPSLPPAPPA